MGVEYDVLFLKNCLKYLLHDGVFAVLEVLKREALGWRNKDNSKANGNCNPSLP